MNSLRITTVTLVVTTTVAVFAGAAAAGRADDDHVEDTKIALMEQLRANLNPVKRQRALVAHLERELADRLDELDAVCGLAEAQRKKLERAGQGEIKRFIDRFTLTVMEGADVSLQEVQGLAVDLRDLHRQPGKLFDAGSLFSKILAATLSREQRARNEPSLRDENRVRYRKAVVAAVHSLAGLVNISNTECVKLSRLILTETKPPLKYGPSDYAFVMYQAARLPEAKLKEVIHVREWATFKWQLELWADSESFLIKEGFVFNEKAGIVRP
jgi:hypothetical protein